ncbi:MAG: ATP-binding protein, partial [bacterium]
MNSLIALYIFIAFLIFGIAFISYIIPQEYIGYFPFEIFYHSIFEGLIALITLFIFIKANNLYSKTGDKRIGIIAGGFLAGSLLQMSHAIVSYIFPYYIFKITKTSCLMYEIGSHEFFYLLFGRWFFSISIFMSIFAAEPFFQTIKNFRRKIYIGFFSFAFLIILLDIIISPFLARIPEYVCKSTYLSDSLEIVDKALFIIASFIYMDRRLICKQNILSKFNLGLLVLGIGQLFFVTPEYFRTVQSILGHIIRISGFSLIFLGLDDIISIDIRYSESFKQRLSAYLSLFLIIFYIIFSLFRFIIFDIEPSPLSPYVFLEFFVVATIIQYILATNLTKPITHVMEGIEKFKPGEKPEKITIMSNDEIGLLTKKFNELTELVWKYTQELLSIQKTETKQREEIEEIRKTFIATLTHDLKSPLIAEQKAIEFMLSKNPETPVKNYFEYLEDIHKTNEELLRIVNNLAAVYHYESGIPELRFEAQNISAMINDTVKSLIYLAKDKNIEITVDINKDLPLVMVDKLEINRVLINLISNAIKHTEKNTKVKIAAQRTGNEVVVSVSDNGSGISESISPKIFQRYPTAKREIGTGLGLYLSAKIDGRF